MEYRVEPTEHGYPRTILCSADFQSNRQNKKMFYITFIDKNIIVSLKVLVGGVANVVFS